MSAREAKARLCYEIGLALMTGGLLEEQADGESEADYLRHEKARQELIDEMMRRSRGYHLIKEQP